MNIVKFSIKKPVLVNMLMIAIFIGGIFSLLRLRREIFPSISTDLITVITMDRTLDAPEDVEKLLTVPIEDELRDIEEIKEIISFSGPNLSTIMLELHENADMSTVLNEVRQEVDQALPDMPNTAEPPITSEMKFPFPVITVGFLYEASANKLDIKKVAEELRNSFERIKDVASVSIAGLNDREIWIEVDPARAKAYGVSLKDVEIAVAAKNVDMPGGTLESKSGVISVRILEQINEESWQELEDIVIKKEGIHIVHLRDVARLKNTFEEDTTLGRVNAKSAVTFTINKQKDGDTINISDDVKALVTSFQSAIPANTKLMYFSDTAKYVRVRLRTMVKNGIISMLLVAVVLLLFMNFKISILVVGGLLVSFLGSFIYLFVTNSSLNMLSLFSLIMVMGMLVDDAIVVCENVYRYMEKGMPATQAAIVGTQEVIWPVVGTVSTTIVAFLPLMLMTGIMGKFLSIIPQVIAMALLLSLVEATVILPSHLAEFIKNKDLHKGQLAYSSQNKLMNLKLFLGNILRRIQALINNILKRVLQYYSYVLKGVLKLRYLVLFGSSIIFLSIFVILKLGILPFILFHADYADRFMISLEAPSYYNLEETSKEALAIEEEIIAEFPPHEIVAIITTIGRRQEDEFSSKNGKNQGSIIVDVAEDDKRTRAPDDLLKDLRRIVSKHKVFTIAKVEAEKGGPPVGKPITVRISGAEYATMVNIIEEYKGYLRQIKGVKELSDDFERNKKELHINIDEDRAAAYNCDVLEIGQEIFSAFEGREVSLFRWGNDEVTIRVKYDEEYTRSSDSILNFELVNKGGNVVPLRTIAKIEMAPGYSIINRRQRKRTLTILGDVDTTQITSIEVNEKMREHFKEIELKYPGYSVEYGGEEEDTAESMRSMFLAFIISLVLIYGILASILDSFVQPFIILLIIPLGLVGVVYGFVIFRLPLGIMGLMGTIGLIGIIVNDSIVMVSFINQYRYKHRHNNPDKPLSYHGRWMSLIKCGVVRFRPIFLTTLTTIVGMSTIAFTRTGQEQFIAPMALAIVCGLFVGSSVTLFITPAIYAVVDDIYIFFTGHPMLAIKHHEVS